MRCRAFALLWVIYFIAGISMLLMMWFNVVASDQRSCRLKLIRTQLHYAAISGLYYATLHYDDVPQILPPKTGVSTWLISHKSAGYLISNLKQATYVFRNGNVLYSLSQKGEYVDTVFATLRIQSDGKVTLTGIKVLP